MRNIKTIKVMRLSLLVAMLSIGLNATAQSSDTEFYFGEKFTTNKSSYVKRLNKKSGIIMSFGGEHRPDKWKLTRYYSTDNDTQSIYFTQEGLDKFTEEIEKALDKAIKWDSIADKNNIDKLKKSMEGIMFTTQGGKIKDRGFELAGPTNSDIIFFRNTYDNITRSNLKVSVFQAGEYSVRSARWELPNVDVKDKEDVLSLREFISFLKISKSILIDKINEDIEKNNKFN